MSLESDATRRHGWERWRKRAVYCRSFTPSAGGGEATEESEFKAESRNNKCVISMTQNGKVSDVTVSSQPLIQSKTPVPTLILKFERHFRVAYRVQQNLGYNFV